MKNKIKNLILATILTLSLTGESALAGVKPGDILPDFKAESLQGKGIDPKSFSDSKPGLLYLFKSKNCDSCSKGLQQLAEVSRMTGNDIHIIALGEGSTEEVRQITSLLNLNFPVAAVNKELFQSFSVSLFPTTFLIGPENKIIKIIQGSSNNLLISIAENAMQRQKNDMAQTVFEKAAKEENPGLSQVGGAYAKLKSGKVEEAQTQFQKLATNPDKNIALHGQEGLATTLLQQGKTDQAMDAAQKALTLAPDRTMANLVKGRILHAKGDAEGAQKALILASADNVADADFGWQKADANLAMGNLHMKNKKSDIALKSFHKAAEQNPYSVEAVSNKGVALTETGKPQKALEVFNQLKKTHPEDRMAQALIRQAQAAMALQTDMERKKYIDGMVKELSERFRTQKTQPPREDNWSSPIGAVSILNFENKTQDALLGRIGVEKLLKDELSRELVNRKVSVVEREILDNVLEELKLGSSELANPKTSTQLGKVTAAHVLSTGSFYDAEKGSTATLRLVETETTNIFLALTEKTPSRIDPSQLATQWAEQIAQKIKEKFPLQGRIVKIKPDEVIINLGQRHAVTEGMIFNVLGDGEAIDLGDGEVMQDIEPIGKIQVTRVQEKAAFAKPLTAADKWTNKQRIILTK
ncbi:MAG: tetratricopeptide repeat protein [Magnetococcales bacterium]|nr:tetratricopeptide repeat protein [Magnetococcales bacterium]